MTFGRLSEYSLLPIRLMLGLILIFHGIGKLFIDAPGITALSGFIGGVGFPVPVFLAWVVALIEFAGGILILIGLWTRPAALLVSIEFIVILLFFVRSNLGFGIGKAELEISILAVALALLVAGAGEKLNLEKAWFKKEVWE